MSHYDLEHLADDSVDDGLHFHARHDRENTAFLLAFIAESDRRRRYAQFGYNSMHSYCMKVLGLSGDAASKRIQVARKARFLPAIFAATADGRVHLSGMNLLVPFLDEENVGELIEAASHRTCREIELLLAERFPKADVEEAITEQDLHATPHIRSRSGVKPIAPGRYVVQFTIGEADHERLQYALQLMSHRNPKGNLSFLNLTALEMLIEQLEKEKFGSTDSPRGIEAASTGRHIPASVCRAVWERDGGRCTWVSPDAGVARASG